MIDEENKRLIARGERKGIKKSKKEIAKEMLNKNFDIETINDITKLSIEEIEKIKNKL